MKCCMIEIAYDDLEQIKETVDDLLDKKLIASAQIIKSESTWNWRNVRENASEYLLVVKTRMDLTKKVYDEVRRYHSYECFEFAIFELTSVSKDYIDWIINETCGVCVA